MPGFFGLESFPKVTEKPRKMVIIQPRSKTEYPAFMEFPFAKFISGKLYVSVSSVRVVVECVDFVVSHGGEYIVNVA